MCDSAVVRRTGVLVLFLSVWLAAGAAHAQNLLPNAGFNTSISGWSPTSGYLALSWSSLDAKGSSGSGSLQMTNTSPIDNNGYNYIGFCVPVTAGVSYHAGGSFYFASGQAHDAGLGVGFHFYSTANCSSGDLGSTFGIVEPAPTNVWFRTDTQPALAPGGALGALVTFDFRKVGDGGSVVASLDDAVFEASGSNLCYWSDDRLCLGGRFTVTAQWTSDTGSGTGHAVALVSDTGSFWFFSPTNLEILVKVLDACGVNGKKWVFGGGLTNVRVVLTITDLQTLIQQTYTNPLDTAYQPVQDTSAFSTCP
jgi:hypothetical protein